MLSTHIGIRLKTYSIDYTRINSNSFLNLTANHTCSKGSLFHLERPNYVINNTHEWGVGIGDYIQVTCLKDIQLFTNDIWDDGKCSKHTYFA